MNYNTPLINQRFPLLTALTESGAIFVDGVEYIGRAADGQEVILGNTANPDQVEQYLSSHPSPRDW